MPVEARRKVSEVQEVTHVQRGRLLQVAAMCEGAKLTLTTKKGNVDLRITEANTSAFHGVESQGSSRNQARKVMVPLGELENIKMSTTEDGVPITIEADWKRN